MTRKILPLILFSLLLMNQLLPGLSEAEDSKEDLTATEQYSLGVIEYNKGNVELAKAWFQQAYERLEEEKTKSRSFGSGLITDKPDASSITAAPAKVQFPLDYKVNVYYRDGWYIQPKDMIATKKRTYSFLPGSTYRILVEAETEQTSDKTRGDIMKLAAAVVMVSWLMAR